MGRSFILAAHLFFAARGAAGATPARTDRPKGRLVWLHGAPETSLASLRHLTTLLKSRQRGLSVLVTQDGVAPALVDFAQGTSSDVLPPDRPDETAAFLDHWRPDLFVVIGTSLPPVAIVEADRRAVPILLANALRSRTGLLKRGMTRSLLGRTRGVLAQDAESSRWFQNLCGRLPPVETTGKIEESNEPLPYNEVERASLAETLGARPVWLAMACPEEEEDAVLSAHERAMRFAHRMLLILVPANPARGVALATKIADRGWTVSRRSMDQEPEADTQVYLADGEPESGLWYRLSPVCYVGGTMTDATSCPNPFEAAALGSAIIHGPHSGAYPNAFARLKAAHATRPIRDASELPEAVDAVAAPDRAALLAHNAWATTSGGAEVADGVVSRILSILNEAGNGVN